MSDFENKKIYGTLDQNDNITFVMEEFICTFINTRKEAKKPFTIISENGYILGTTVNKEKIYIIYNKEIVFYEIVTLNTWIYFISRSNVINSFNSISFSGGILQKLFSKSTFDMKSSNNDKEEITYRDDTIKFDLPKELDGNLSVRTWPVRSISVEDGTSIKSSDVLLELNFNKEKKLDYFSEIFSHILMSCQFMAFRKNIKFNMIKLYKDNSKKGFPSEIECYVKYDDEKVTEKKWHSCIHFDELGHNSKLLKLLIDKKTKLLFGYIPINDKDSNWISSIKVKEICAALETEIEFNSKNNEASKEMNQLKKDLNELVKKHQTGEHAFENQKTYTNIFNTLSHISESFADRLYSFFVYFQPLTGEAINKREVEDFVKYRNAVTHGRHKIINSEIASTADVLIKLIYCSILNRIGLEDEQIKKIIRKTII